MYKYTYIQAAGGKRITKRYKVRLLTIAGERANGRRDTVAAGRQCCNQANAAGRSTTPTTRNAPAHKRADMSTRPRARAGGTARAGGLSCSSCRPAGSIFARYFQRRGAASIVYRLGAYRPKISPKIKPQGAPCGGGIKKAARRAASAAKIIFQSL